MALGDKKKSGSVHADGTRALTFKKGSANYTETPGNVNKRKDPLRSAPERPKPIDPNQQHRSSGESIQDFMKRREKNRQ